MTDNVSGYAAESLARRIRRDLMGKELRRYQEENGAFTAEERAAADVLLHGPADADEAVA